MPNIAKGRPPPCCNYDIRKQEHEKDCTFYKIWDEPKHKIKIEVNVIFETDNSDPCSALDDANSFVSLETHKTQNDLPFESRCLELQNAVLMESKVNRMLDNESKAEAVLIYECSPMDFRSERTRP